MFPIKLKSFNFYILIILFANFFLNSLQLKANNNQNLININNKSKLISNEKGIRESLMISNLIDIKKENSIVLLDKYILGPGDLLSIKFLGSDFLEEFSGTFPILNDGNINLPIIGTKYLSDLSLNQAKGILMNEYAKEIISPNIYLQLVSARPIKVSIIG